MAYQYPYQHPAAQRLSMNPQAARPDLPPVPPQLRSPAPSHPLGSPPLPVPPSPARPSSGMSVRPPLPPIPGTYLAQAAAEHQRTSNGHVVSPRPYRAEAVIPAESLQSQADTYAPLPSTPSRPFPSSSSQPSTPNLQPPRLQLDFQQTGGSSLAPWEAPPGPHESNRPASAHLASPPSLAPRPPLTSFAPRPHSSYEVSSPMSGRPPSAGYGSGPTSAVPVEEQLAGIALTDAHVGRDSYDVGHARNGSTGYAGEGPAHPMAARYGSGSGPAPNPLGPAFQPHHPGPPLPPHPPLPSDQSRHGDSANGYGHNRTGSDAVPRPNGYGPSSTQLGLSPPGPSSRPHSAMTLPAAHLHSPQRPSSHSDTGYRNSFAGPPAPPRSPAPTSGGRGRATPSGLAGQAFAPQPEAGPSGHRLVAQPVADLSNLSSTFIHLFGPGSLTSPSSALPTSTSALAKLSGAQLNERVRWARQVLRFVERQQAELASAGGSTRISDPTLVRFVDVALKIILSSSEPPISSGESLYLRADLSSTGSFPAYKTKDPRAAFRDFESAANRGYKASWFRIGREYEAFGEWERARSAHEKGMSMGDCASTYRLGMAYLLGQMGFQPDTAKSIAYLRSAADLADLDTPQPAYIFGMLLAGEFESLPSIPPDILPPNVHEARSRIGRAAYLGFAAAQYKMGWLHEYGQMGCEPDPLLSVEYYSLASKQGEVEADLALSKWFLCGAPDCFPTNEALAMTFAEKAARKGLGSAMFAVGYYLEVGIGIGGDPSHSGRGEPDLAGAQKWYARAVEAGNSDAEERLKALRQGGAEAAVSRNEFERNVDVELVRKRTMAVQSGRMPPRRGGRLSRAPSPQPPVPPPTHPASAGRSSTPNPGPATNGNGNGYSPPRQSPPKATALRRNETMRRVEEARMQAASTVQESKAGKALRKAKARPAMPNGAASNVQRYQLTDGNGPSQPPPPQIVRPTSPNGSVASSTFSTASKKSNKSRPTSIVAGLGSTATVAAGGATGTSSFQSFEAMGIPTTKASSSTDCVVM